MNEFIANLEDPERYSGIDVKISIIRSPHEDAWNAPHTYHKPCNGSQMPTKHPTSSAAKQFPKKIWRFVIFFNVFSIQGCPCQCHPPDQWKPYALSCAGSYPVNEVLFPLGGGCIDGGTQNFHPCSPLQKFTRLVFEKKPEGFCAQDCSISIRFVGAETMVYLGMLSLSQVTVAKVPY